MAVGLRLGDVEGLVHVGPALAAVDGREEQARQQEGAAHGGGEAVSLGPLHAAAALAGKGPPFREGPGAGRRGLAARAPPGRRGGRGGTAAAGPGRAGPGGQEEPGGVGGGGGCRRREGVRRAAGRAGGRCGLPPAVWFPLGGGLKAVHEWLRVTKMARDTRRERARLCAIVAL